MEAKGWQNTISLLRVCLLNHTLGVNVTEWDRKVSVADCVVVLFRKNSKFYSNMIPIVVMLVTYATHTCHYEARAYRRV
jgi:hypothetical protein